MCILYNQRDATYTMFFIIISALHILGSFSTHHQELIKLYVQPWIFSSFPAVYRWCGWVGTTTIYWYNGCHKKGGNNFYLAATQLYC
jgi:hypothetical protein